MAWPGRSKTEPKPCLAMQWIVRAAVLFLGVAVLVGCSHLPAIVGTWKYTFPAPNPSNEVLFTTFNTDGTFHTERRASDRGDPVSRARGTFTFKGGQLTEEIDRPGTRGPVRGNERQVWTATISGDTLNETDESKLGARSMVWHRVG